MSNGDLRTESRSVELGDATSARVGLKLGVGELRVAGGAAALLDAEFRYNVEEWRPEVEYAVRDGRGELTVRQPSGTGRQTSNARYEWDLRLNDDVPLDLRVNAGVGKSELMLGSLSLTGLAIETGVGSATIDLTGDRSRDLEATIKGGVGKTTVKLPGAVGVRVEAKGGIGRINARGLRQVEGAQRGPFPFIGSSGAYVNDAYGQSATTLRLTIESGVGEIELVLDPALAR